MEQLEMIAESCGDETDFEDPNNLCGLEYEVSDFVKLSLCL